MRALLHRLRQILDIFVRRIFGHTQNCCGHSTERCKKCPFNTEEVKKIVKKQKEKEHKGYIDISKEVKNVRK